MYYYDWIGLAAVLLAFIFSLTAQIRIKTTFSKYSKIGNMRSMTGAQASRMILDRNGLQDVKIERVPGSLTDHFDPTANVIRLSQSVYDSTSVAAIGVAAHETGHAIQYAKDYAPMKVRAAIIPITQFGSSLSMPLILIGFLFSIPSFVYFGICCFALVALFQFVTLPVEFNASRRALATLEENYILQSEELKSTKKVLTAAAMTYVAALAVSLAQIFRLLLLAGRRR